MRRELLTLMDECRPTAAAAAAAAATTATTKRLTQHCYGFAAIYSNVLLMQINCQLG